MRPNFYGLALAMLAGLASTLAAPVLAQQAAYPARPIKLVVAFAAGGIADSVARQIGVKLGARLGQPVVVENRGGAGGNIGAKTVSGAEPDGYTLLVTTAALAVNTSLYKSPGYTVTDFVPIALAASTPNLFATNAANPATSLKDLARDYKGRQFTYSTAGIGSSSHLTAHYVFRNLLGMDAVHVPYQGGAPAVNAAVAGHVDLVSVSMPTAMTNVKAGRLKGIAVASLKRVDALPGVATVAESGFRDFEDRSWVGVLAPAKTSPEIARRLNAEIHDILRQPDVREQLAAVGFEPSTGSTPEFADYLKKEVAKWSEIVKATGVTIND
ncbi:MAG: tripartite tricarboxylate transporter substrate binding protein [Pseudomonadota bacterium]